MYYVTFAAKRKNAKRHKASKYKTLTEAKTAALQFSKRYVVTVVSGNWELLAIRCTDDHGNFYMWEV